ncbi:hypothetical protein L218DRAFT_867173 [Marasmius fiardii PR-910]|nr:hypothetical protein L218DRAFT_867173 [Marasmius fiardii PR-910]
MDSVSINGFMFCRPHGSEYCSTCYCDHRLCNNVNIEGELAEAFPGFSEDQLLGRPPLSNVISGKAVISEQRITNGELLYQCTAHDKVDCDTCFDWGKRVVEEFKRIASTFGKEIPVEMTRDEKLGFLASMGIELPSTTRLPDDALDKKLHDTMDAAQYFKDAISKTPVDPKSLPLWPLGSAASSGSKLWKATVRGNLGEVLGRDGIYRSRSELPFSEYEKTFMALRVIVGELAKGMDEGDSSLLLQDKEQSSCIFLRVLRKADSTDDGAPIFFVLYTQQTHNTPVLQTLGWLSDQMRKGVTPIQITTPLEVQKLLLKFLHLNSKRLSSSYHPTRQEFETRFPSFIIPIGPITQMKIGNLTRSAGCVLCGSKTSKKCSSCLAVDYCGPECQKAHWKEHKAACKSLKGGAWCIVQVGTAHDMVAGLGVPGYRPDMFMSNLSFQDPLQGSRKSPGATSASPSTVAPNVHGNNPFLVKIQRAMGNDDGAMMIYDRQRSFQLHLIRSKDVASHTEALRQMNTSTTGLKIYRWAKRTGDKQLSICFDRPPPSDPLW